MVPSAINMVHPITAAAVNIVTKEPSAFVSLCSKAAPIVCSGVFVAPFPTIANIISTKTVGVLPLLPYSSMFVNAFIWTIYGILTAEAKVWQPNIFGCAMAAYYCVQYKKYTPNNAFNLPGTLSQHIRYGFLLMTFTLLMATLLDKSTASYLIGKLGVLLCLVLFASPLSTLKTVIATKSAKSIPLPFTLGMGLNCFLWSVAGLFDLKDFNIYFPNILGLLSCIAQFALKIIYGNGHQINGLPV